MAGDQTMCCIVCNTHNKTTFHKITYESTPPEAPSLAERVSKILKVDDIYAVYQDRVLAYPLQLCSTCLAELTQIESALKAKKKFKKSFKKVFGQTQLRSSTSGAGGDGCLIRERKRSGQRFSSAESKKKKERKKDCELSAKDLELCIKEIDELITQTLQNELINKSKSPEERTDESELLSTELAIVKEMFCEMEKEVGKIESPTKLTGSTKPGGVIHELLMKQRITSEYKDKLVQHLKRMISYMSKYSSKFESSGEGLQKFCDILEIVFSQDSTNKDLEKGDIDDGIDSLSMSSSQSSMSCSSISLNLKQSVEDIFKQTASQIAQAWLETRSSTTTATDQPLVSSNPSDDKEEQTGTEKKEKELAIGEQVQKIINGEEDEEQEIIDIESLGSEEINEEEEEEEAPSDKAKETEGSLAEESSGDKEKEKVEDVKGGASSSSDQDGAMVIDSDDEESDQDTAAEHEVKKENIASQDDIQEIEQAKKDYPVICIDSDEDNDDDKVDKQSSEDSTTASEPFHDPSKLSYEESRWQFTQERPDKPAGQGNTDCFIVTDTATGSANPQSKPPHLNNSNSGGTMPASGSKGVFSQKGKIFRSVSDVFGNMCSVPPLGGGQQRQMKQSQQRHDNHFLGKRQTNVWPAGKGTQGQLQSNSMGYVSQNKFKFGKKYKYRPKKNKQFVQQGGFNATDNNMYIVSKNKMGKGQKQGMAKQQNLPRSTSKIPSLLSLVPAPASKLDIVPVISGRKTGKQMSASSGNGQGSKMAQGTAPHPVTNQTKSQNRKFKFKKKHQGKQQHNKKQHHYNPGSKPPGGIKQPHNQGNYNFKTPGGRPGGIKQPHNQGNSNIKALGVNPGGRPGGFKQSHNQGNSNLKAPGRPGFQKSPQQPPVMQVLGSASSQTLKVKASW